MLTVSTWEWCVLEHLPFLLALCVQLAKVIHMGMLKESPILRDAPTQFFELLALKFTQVFAMPDEIIFRYCCTERECVVPLTHCVVLATGDAVGPRGFGA